MEQVKFKKLHADAIIPEYAHAYGDAGMDLFSVEDTTIAAGERKIIKTGIASALPPNTVGMIFGKSGLAAKFGITTLGGVVDETYRGEIGVILLNTGERPFEIKKGSKIAQYVMLNVKYCEVTEAEELFETERSSNGFGSTGLSKK